MFVGEYGIPRREFLYDIRFWEAKRIIRGYRRRNILQYQLQRIQAWASMFCMGNPNRKSPSDIFKLYFDDDEEDIPPISEEDQAELQALMAAENERIRREKESSEE